MPTEQNNGSMRDVRRQLHTRRVTTLLGHVARRLRRARPAAPVAPQRQAEIEQELLLARDLQQGLLLEAVPRLPGWEISAVSLPARDLGGDLYDFLPIAEGWQGIMIGDVSGKGLPAALRMAVARTVFRHEARRGDTPGSTLAAVNRSLLVEIPQGMVTMLYALLDTRSGFLRIANAGHIYPMLIDGCVREVELSGLPLGVDDESAYEELCAAIHPGDVVLLYTDGVVEATNASNEIFGYDRLERLLRANEHLKPRNLMATLLHELRAWSGGHQADDITVVIVRRRLLSIGAELRSIAGDVLGSERVSLLWDAGQVPADTAAPEAWAEALPAIVQLVQAHYGRGLARELNAQLRLAIEEYRKASETR